MKLRYIISLFLAALLVAGCGNKKEGVSQKEMSEHKSQLRSLPELNLTDSCKASGHLYVYTIDRVSSDSLGVITDEFGDQFANTQLSITVRKDGAQLFHKVFRKENFKQYLTADFLSQSILDGCRFDKVDGGKVIFALAVSYPDSDMSQSFSLTIANDGSYSIEKVDIDFLDEEDSTYDADGV